ncbi:MAG: FAD-binding oxidoreductase [Thermotogae bacterium]|nr:FAD-binding oxidoreductase [Thermotogota bacterium]
MRSEASVVIIGAGIIGTSIAFNLAKMGIKGISIFEKSYISSGSTGRCGGGIRQQWTSPMNVRLAMRSVEIFRNFKRDVGMDIEYYQGGYLLLANTDEEVIDFENNVKMQRDEGLNVEILTPRQIVERFPFINVEDVKMGTWCPTDGHANPQIANIAYAFALKRMGVDVNTHTTVEDIYVQNNQIIGVQTSKGYLKTNVVVNAAGGFSREVGVMGGVEIPTHSERHQILVTEGVNHILDPMVISFHNNYYVRQTMHGSLVMGQSDKNPVQGIDLGHTIEFLEEMAPKMVHDFPFMKHLHIVRQWSGAYNVSPDAQPIIGESRDVSRYLFAVGFSGHGFMLAPAVGEAVAEMIVYGSSKTVDISNLSIERFKKKIKRERNVV